MTTHIIDRTNAANAGATALLNSTIDAHGNPLTGAQMRTATLAGLASSPLAGHEMFKHTKTAFDKAQALRKARAEIDLTDFSDTGKRKHLRKLLAPHLAEIKNLRELNKRRVEALLTRPAPQLPRIDESKATRLFLHFRDASAEEQNRIRNRAVSGEAPDYALCMINEPFLYGISEERLQHLVTKVTGTPAQDPDTQGLVTAAQALEDELYEAEAALETEIGEPSAPETDLERAQRIARAARGEPDPANPAEPQPDPGHDRLTRDLNEIMRIARAE